MTAGAGPLGRVTMNDSHANREEVERQMLGRLETEATQAAP
jgi:hypothetical protein